jgi:hypothetical protein
MELTGMNSSTSCDNLPFELKQRAYLLYWNEQTTEFFLPNTVLLIIYLCIGIIGNLSVILVYQFRLKKKQDGRYFVAPLAWMDCIALIVTASLNLTRNTRQVTYPQHGTCKMLIYFSYVTTSSSLYLLAAIALQRYLKICKPFGRQMNLWWKRLSVSLCAAIAIILYLPVPFFYGVVEVQNPALGNVTAHKCGVLPTSLSRLKQLRIFQVFGFVGTIATVVIMTVLYSIITVSIVKQLRKKKRVKMKSEDSSIVISDATASAYAPKITNPTSVSTSDLDTSVVDTFSKLNVVENKPSSQRDAMKSTFRISFMFMTISIVGFLAYLPSWVFIVIETNNPFFWKRLPVAAFHVCLTLRRMYMINHLANPFIYGVFDKVFRREITNMFCKK